VSGCTPWLVLGWCYRVGVGPMGHLVHASLAPLRRGFFCWIDSERSAITGPCICAFCPLASSLGRSTSPGALP
jgi:hypothetical protein